MKTKKTFKCPACGSSDTLAFKSYNTVHNGTRQLLICRECKNSFSETSNTAMENIKSPISKVASALGLRCEGLGLRATARVLQANKQTITEWERRFADKKETLMLYAFCHNFISLTFEGDELYTTVDRRTDPEDSEGWTAVISKHPANHFYSNQREYGRFSQ